MKPAATLLRSSRIRSIRNFELCSTLLILYTRHISSIAHAGMALPMSGSLFHTIHLLLFKSLICTSFLVCFADCLPAIVEKTNITLCAARFSLCIYHITYNSIFQIHKSNYILNMLYKSLCNLITNDDDLCHQMLKVEQNMVEILFLLCYHHI